MEENNLNFSETQDTNKKKSKALWWVLMGIALALLLAAITVFCIQFFGGKEEFDDYKNNTSTSSDALPANPIDFKKIQTESPDVCAWIQVDGTVIDYPILQSSAEADDNFYLDHDRFGTSKVAGSVYIQKLNRKNFSDPNTLIYGHNMRNGTMFGQLKKFRDKEFFEENRNIYIYTPSSILKYEIISAFIYDNRHIMNSFNFFVESSRMQFFDECINPTSLTKQVVEGATLDSEDKIITLSTCTGNDKTRYLVVGKLISETETEYSGLTAQELSNLTSGNSN